MSRSEEVVYFIRGEVLAEPIGGWMGASLSSARSLEVCIIEYLHLHDQVVRHV